MKTIIFELTSAIKFASGKSGTEVECNFIELREPTGRSGGICSAMEGLLKSASIKLAGQFSNLQGLLDGAQTEVAAAEGPDAQSALLLVDALGEDAQKFLELFKQLCIDVALMGGEKPCTMPRINDMSYRDLRNMMGVYVANFILS